MIHIRTKGASMKVIKNLSIVTALALCLVSCSELLFWKKEDVRIYQTIRVEDGEEWMECEITDKEPARIIDDVSYFWIKNRVVHATPGDFAGHLLHGQFERFYTDGSLKEKGEFRYGLKEGPWKSWNSDQLLVAEYNFRKGMKNGPFKEYRGKDLIKSGTYEDDAYSGKLFLHTDPAIEALVYKRGAVTDTVFISSK